MAMSNHHPHAHDHDRCIADALSRAEALCADRGARLTDLRRQVFELVLGSHRPVGAYDLVARLGEVEGKTVAPQTVYRALDFLIEQGLVHRIASLNAFVGCSHPGTDHAGQFMICNRCHEVAELGDPAAIADLAARAAAQGFKVDTVSIELTGTCAACRAG
ncbi:Fur family transcriptional regulator [Zavarzinia sp.]|uniref:Fur family transcriptional regulator n=1 Tax=Zavarzinia sp. TaxID=2027920 RepID=UPI003568668B